MNILKKIEKLKKEKKVFEEFIDTADERTRGMSKNLRDAIKGFKEEIKLVNDYYKDEWEVGNLLRGLIKDEIQNVLKDVGKEMFGKEYVQENLKLREEVSTLESKLRTKRMKIEEAMEKDIKIKLYEEQIDSYKDTFKPNIINQTNNESGRY